MKVNKNWCTTCQVNFFTETMFFQHIVGEWPQDPQSTGVSIPVGSSKRHHLTEAELHDLGWSCQELQVSEWLDGNKVLIPRMTWVMPGQLEKHEANDRRMAEMSKKVGFKKVQK